MVVLYRDADALVSPALDRIRRRLSQSNTAGFSQPKRSGRDYLGKRPKEAPAAHQAMAGVGVIGAISQPRRYRPEPTLSGRSGRQRADFPEWTLRGFGRVARVRVTY
jgi:hypothetical protein